LFVFTSLGTAALHIAGRVIYLGIRPPHPKKNFCSRECYDMMDGLGTWVLVLLDSKTRFTATQASIENEGRPDVH
jgi:hypothetical protein